MERIREILSALVHEMKISQSIMRQFALVMGIMLGAIVPLIIVWLNDWELGLPAGLVASLGVVFLFIGILFPMALKKFYIVWMLLALGLGFIVTRIIITVVFYLMITPIGFIRRHLGTKDPIGLKINPDEETYWVPAKNPPASQLKKQF